MVEMTNPAVIVVGKVEAMDLDWFEAKPLFGKTIAVMHVQASELVHMLRVLGAQVLEVPTIAFAEHPNWCEVDCGIANIHTFDWLVLTSTNGTDRFFERLFKQGRDVRTFGRDKNCDYWRSDIDADARVASRFRSRSCESHIRRLARGFGCGSFGTAYFCCPVPKSLEMCSPMGFENAVEKFVKLLSIKRLCPSVCQKNLYSC